MAAVPSVTWKMLGQKTSGEPLPRGLDAAWNAGIGRLDRYVPRSQKLFRRIEKILVLEKHFSEMSDSKLREVAGKLCERFRCRRDNSSDLERAFALVGFVAEMATGEGKTLTSTLPVTVAGWRGQGCHVITVNDYLARRDAEWMGQIYRFCGLSVAYIEQQTPPAERKIAYMADITYCTNKEVTADFLRDRLVLGHLRGLSSTLLAKVAGGDRQVADRLVQRGLHCAFVDEADSILIDESVTPLIISGHAPNPEQIESFRQATLIASQLKSEVDYRINHRYREIELTREGESHLEELASGLGGLWQGNRRCWEMVNQALTAKELYLQDKHYLIDDGKVVIVDEFTGRMMPDRTWRDGLHQAIEAKEKVEVNPPKDTYARISFQRFFRIYRKLSGMTGTAAEAAAEFWQIYQLPVVTIPTNRPCIRKSLPNIILPTKSAKWTGIVQQIRRIHETDRPILVGTCSVRSSEHLSQLLKAEKLEHQVLNAVYHQQEAQIVAGAGQRGKITVATNMAGRGTDIKLGRGVAELGGLHVIAAEPNESARIDRQLFGRGARQGDPGSAQGIFSLEDEIVSRHARNIAAYLKRRHARAKNNISSNLVQWVFRLAQSRAERLALRRRKSVLRTDHWLDEQLGFAGRE
ncbi:MAG: preprotein translocase subunit SecA [Planctomycetota bacterium]|jgi:preprotein translocase subunit SecA